MLTNILDGKKLAANIRKDLALSVLEIKNKVGRVPVLAVIMVGNEASSALYVKNKEAACAEVGIISKKYVLSSLVSELELIKLIEQLNHDVHVDGILLQLPLPSHIKADVVLEIIHPSKDVDGFHPYNIGRLLQRRPIMRPCTPKGVMALLDSVSCHYSSSDVVILGSSNIVGRPMALELLQAGATVTVCHSKTKDINKYLKMADIVITAVGQPGLVKGENLKEGVVLIDVGITRLESGQIVGDIDFVSAVKKAKWITPVPGGVGPMTVAMLLDNTVLAMSMRVGLA